MNNDMKKEEMIKEMTKELETVSEKHRLDIYTELNRIKTLERVQNVINNENITNEEKIAELYRMFDTGQDYDEYCNDNYDDDRNDLD